MAADIIHMVLYSREIHLSWNSSYVDSFKQKLICDLLKVTRRWEQLVEAITSNSLVVFIEEELAAFIVNQFYAELSQPQMAEINKLLVEKITEQHWLDS